MTASKKFIRLAKLLTSLCCQSEKGSAVILPEFDVFLKTMRGLHRQIRGFFCIFFKAVL
jgi:hypothetical protein